MGGGESVTLHDWSRQCIEKLTVPAEHGFVFLVSREHFSLGYSAQVYLVVLRIYLW